jgi:hypothetical protein
VNIRTFVLSESFASSRLQQQVVEPNTVEEKIFDLYQLNYVLYFYVLYISDVSEKATASGSKTRTIEGAIVDFADDFLGPGKADFDSLSTICCEAFAW